MKKKNILKFIKSSVMSMMIEGSMYLAIHSFRLNDMERVKIRKKKTKFGNKH